MPRVKRRTLASRRTWDDDHRCFLSVGFTIDRDHEWGKYFARRPWPKIPAEVLEEMAAGWEHFRDEIISTRRREPHYWSSKRPGGWWLFESPEPRDDSMTEREQLLAMGVITVPNVR